MMIDEVPSWGEALNVDEWTPTADVDVVIRIYDDYEELPSPVP